MLCCELDDDGLKTGLKTWPFEIWRLSWPCCNERDKGEDEGEGAGDTASEVSVNGVYRPSLMSDYNEVIVFLSLAKGVSRLAAAFIVPADEWIYSLVSRRKTQRRLRFPTLSILPRPKHDQAVVLK